MSAEERATAPLTAFEEKNGPEPSAIEYRVTEPGKFDPPATHELVRDQRYRTDDPKGIDLADELGAIEVIEWRE